MSWNYRKDPCFDNDKVSLLQPWMTSLSKPGYSIPPKYSVIETVMYWLRQMNLKWWKNVQKCCPTQRANTKPNSRHNVQNGAFWECAVSFLKCTDFQKQNYHRSSRFWVCWFGKFLLYVHHLLRWSYLLKKKNVENTKHINITLQNSKFYTLVNLMQTSVLLSL